MKNLWAKIKAFHFPETLTPLAILGLCAAAYGLMIPWIGFYWDDWPFTWIYDTFGPAGLTTYFETKRPVLAWIYQLTMPLVGNLPWKWHIFGLAWRWISAAALWLLLRKVWPQRRELAVWAALLFAVYPGFDQTYIPIAYAHYFLTESFFFVSLLLTVLAVRARLREDRRRFMLLTGLALAASLVNLMTTEYFFLLDLVRPLLIWVVLAQDETQGKRKWRRALLLGLPYLALFLVPVVWRVFFFAYQTYSYSPVLLEQLRGNFFGTLRHLAGTVLHDLWLVSGGAWAKAFSLPDAAELGRANWLRYWLIVAGVAVGIGVYLFKLKDGIKEPDQGLTANAAGKTGGYLSKALVGFLPMKALGNVSPLQMLGIGLFAMLIAGWPYWVTGLPLALAFPNSRFTLSFMLGVSLLTAALIGLLPRWRWLRAAALALLLGFGVGLQFLIALDYRVDWNNHTRMFWQMTWRIPALEPHTAVIGNYQPPTHYSDNSLSAPLNAIYAPGDASEDMAYMYYFPELRAEMELANFVPGQPIEHDYLVATFRGNTSQAVGLYYHPRFCLRVLDPDLDPLNPLLPEDMRQAAALSSTEWIKVVPADQAARPPQAIFGDEPAREGWCYAFTQADLARQQGKWALAAAMIGDAVASGAAPRTPSEWLLPIEAAAHAGDWQAALDYTARAMTPAYAEQPSMAPVVCRLWQRINKSTANREEKETTLDIVANQWNCTP
jgi:hypothetical protein